MTQAIISTTDVVPGSFGINHQGKRRLIVSSESNGEDLIELGLRSYVETLLDMKLNKRILTYDDSLGIYYFLANRKGFDFRADEAPEISAGYHARVYPDFNNGSLWINEFALIKNNGSIRSSLGVLIRNHGYKPSPFGNGSRSQTAFAGIRNS